MRRAITPRMRRPVILLDVDGPMADFAGAFLRTLAKELRLPSLPYTEEDVTKHEIHECSFFIELASQHSYASARDLRRYINMRIQEPGWCEEIDPKPEAIAAVRELHELAEVHALTSPWHTSPTWCFERTRWLEQHFSIKPDKVHQTASKRIVWGDMLVDDRPDHVEPWAKHWVEGVGVLFDMPHNRDAPMKHGARAGWPFVVAWARSFAK